MLTKTLDLFERFVVAVEKIAENKPATVVTEKAPAVAAPPAEKKAAAPKKAPAAAEKPAAPPAEKAPLVEAVDDDLLGGSEPAVTLDMLLALVPELLKTIDKAKVKAVIETVGNAARISEIKPDKYAATHAALKALV
jgi:hypothetical protein